MPLIKRYKEGNTELFLWKTEESVDELLHKVGESKYFLSLMTPRRQREWLTWQLMVKTFIGNDVITGYNSLGAPILLNHSAHISISHSSDYVALCMSDSRCGVDIELKTRNYSKVASRIVSAKEEEFDISLVWCAKEALYKYASKEGLSFLEDIKVLSLSPTHITTDLCGEKILLRYYIYNNLNIVFTTFAATI